MTERDVYVTNTLHDDGTQMFSGARPVITELPKGTHIYIPKLLSLLVQSTSHDLLMVHVHVLSMWHYILYYDVLEHRTNHDTDTWINMNM